MRPPTSGRLTSTTTSQAEGASCSPKPAFGVPLRDSIYLAYFRERRLTDLIHSLLDETNICQHRRGVKASVSFRVIPEQS